MKSINLDNFCQFTFWQSWHKWLAQLNFFCFLLGVCCCNLTSQTCFWYITLAFKPTHLKAWLLALQISFVKQCLMGIMLHVRSKSFIQADQFDLLEIILLFCPRFTHLLKWTSAGQCVLTTYFSVAHCHSTWWSVLRFLSLYVILLIVSCYW